VIQPARAVAPNAAVDHPSIGQPEDEGMTGNSGSPVSGSGQSPRCHLTAIFEDPLAGRDGP
jgi:hypothetical protein